MNFSIKPYIHSDDDRFNTMFSEIYSMSESMIDDGIISCQYVLSGQHEQLNWGLEVFELTIEKHIARLEYHGEFVSSIPTSEFMKLLQKYKEALGLLRELSSGLA